MAVVRLSRAAQADFDAIIDHLSQVAGPTIALNYATRLRDVANRLVQFPGLGAPRSHLGPTTRTIAIAPYVLVYDGGPKDEVVHILRILHGRMDITPDLIARGRGP